MNIYVGNIAWAATEEDLFNLFSAFGKVKSAKIIIDRDTNRSKGFGFVTMENPSDNDAAIDGANGKELKGRQLKVNLALDKKKPH